MDSLQIQVTSNSTPESIQKDFQNCSQVSKLNLSLEIQVDHEEHILKSIIDQIHQIVSLEDISITIEPFCILEHFQIFTEGLSILKYIKSLTVKFSSTCFAGQTQFSHLASAIKSLSLLTNLSILVDEKNYFDKSQIALLSECFSTLKELTTLKIQISNGNSFSDQAITELCKGLAKIINLKDLSLSLDFSKIYSDGMVEFGNTIKSLKQLSKLELTLLNKCTTHADIKEVFEAIASLSQLKSLLIDPSNTLQLQQSMLENIIKGFSNLTQLESLSLRNLFGKQEALDNLLLMKTVSNLTQLKSLDTQIMNFNQIYFENIDVSTDYLNKLVNLTHLNLEIKDVKETRNNQFVSILSTSIREMKELISLKITFECKTEKGESLSFVDSINGLHNLNSLDLIFSDEFFLDSDIYNSLGQSLHELLNLKSLSLFTNNPDPRYESNISMKIFTKKSFLKSLARLSKLEELQLKGIQIENQNNETLVEALQNLVALKKLSISSFYYYQKFNSLNTFSIAFNELKNLTDLDLSLHNNNLEHLKGNLNFFGSFAQLGNLQNLKLFIEEIDELIFQYLGNALSSIHTLITLEIRSSTCQLPRLKHVVSQLKSPQLKELTIEIKELEDEITNLDNMFEGIQNLQIFKLVINRNSMLNFGKMLFQAFSTLTNLNSIHIESPNLFFAQDNYQSLSDCLKRQQNLLSLKLIDSSTEANMSALSFLREGLESSKKLRVIDLQFVYVKKMFISLVNTSTGIRNLRQNIQYINIIYSHDENLITNFKQIDEYNCSRYLTQLKICSRGFSESGDLFVNAFRSIRYYRYLNTFSLEPTAFQKGLKSDEVSVLGQSLQSISNLQQLILKFSLHKDVSEEVILQLSQGIRCQQELQEIELEVYLEGINDFTRLNSIAQSVKYLTDLERIEVTIGVNNPVEEIIKLDFFDILGKSIADHSHLKNINLNIKDFQNTLKNRTVSLENFLSNPILQDFRFNFNRREEKFLIGHVSISQDIRHLSQLQILQVQFGKSENISNQGLLHFSENLKYLKSLRYLNLTFIQSCVQNPLLIKTITNNINSLKFLSHVDLIFNNFNNIEEQPLEVESIFKSQQVQSSINGRLTSIAAIEKSKLFTHISLECNDFLFVLQICQETERVLQDYLLHIEKLVLNIPKRFIISFQLHSILTNDLEDFVKVISQIQISEMSLDLYKNESLNDGLIDILKGVSNMTNLLILNLDFLNNSFSHQLMKASLKQLSKSKNLQFLYINHYDYVGQKLNYLDFNESIKSLGELKNLKSMFIQSPFFDRKFYLSSFRLTNRLLQKLVYFKLYNQEQRQEEDDEEFESDESEDDEEENQDEEEEIDQIENLPIDENEFDENINLAEDNQQLNSENEANEEEEHLE